MSADDSNDNPTDAAYAIGIDLGTTNCVLAYASLAERPDPGESPKIRTLPIPQFVAAGTVESRPALPSFVFLPMDDEATGQLPWSHEDERHVVGQWARDQAATSPLRTVAAAKSWLAHSGVDRRSDILPWQGEGRTISPVGVCTLLLTHLSNAWDHAFPETPISGQRIAVTVPASFDAAARELVREACDDVLGEAVVLLEEPQAALYAWLLDRGERWRQELSVGDRVFVCDVGGGTTDFTLIDVTESDGELQLERAAVGRHLLVGGDNMDLALAHFAAGEFEKAGVSLDPWQSVSLWHAARRAKETVLAEDGPASTPIAVQRRGRSLVGGTESIDLDRDAAADRLADGFFPDCELSDPVQTPRASGFLEMGLPFEADTAITRHIAAFLSQHCTGDADGDSRPPTHVLFNGGVFEADRFREQVVDRLHHWFPDRPCDNLDAAADLHGAVARGAAFYLLSRNGRGVRIRGGAPRSYYIGLETSGLAIPGAPRPLHALCVLPRGMEEGTEAEVPVEGVGVVVGQPVQFRFFSSPVRLDEPGTRLPRWDESELSETDPVSTTLDAGANEPGAFVPVQFESHLTELGELELWCVDPQSDQRWKMAFSVRE